MSSAATAGPTRCWAALLLCLLLSACGGGSAPAPEVFDDGYERSTRSGLAAFERGRLRQAESAFRRALELADQRGDSRAIVDARYNLAATLVELEDYDEALRLLDAASAELRRDSRAPAPDLQLLTSTVRYRRGETDAAAALARQVIASAPDTTLARRGWFLLGLIAADGGNQAGLAESLAALGEASDDPRLRADRAELNGRLAATRSQWAQAISAFGEAARLRSRAGDYRATARALAAAGASASSAGLPGEAATHFLLAGRSAAARGDAEPAREWLTQARDIAGSAGDAQTVREAEAALQELEAQ